MKHYITVGKPIRKGDKITGHTEVQEVPANEGFRWMRRGFKVIPETAAKKATEKKAPAAKETSAGNGQDLDALTVKELRVVASDLGVSGRLKSDLIDAIEQARAA